MHRNTKYTTEEWINKAKEKWGDRYDYSKVNYQGARISVVIGCPVHGFISMFPHDHLRNREGNNGCKRCGIENSKKVSSLIGNIYKNKIKVIDELTFDELPDYVQKIKKHSSKVKQRVVNPKCYLKLQCLKCKRLSYIHRRTYLLWKSERRAERENLKNNTCQWCYIRQHEFEVGEMVGLWKIMKFRLIPSPKFSDAEIKARSEARIPCTFTEYYCKCTKCNKTKGWMSTRNLSQIKNLLEKGERNQAGCFNCRPPNPGKHGLSKRDENGRMNWYYERFLGIRASCNKRGIPFNITYEYLVELGIPDKCPVLGIPIILPTGKPSKNTRTDNSPSVDKFYPALGYVKGNVQIISWRANHLKSDGSPEEWIKVSKWCKKKDIKMRLEGKHPSQQ